jgi:protocatechuate 3,4-dioxygenase alpha subunit
MSEVRTDLVATPSQTVGPFFHFGLTPPIDRAARPDDVVSLGNLAPPGTRGERISLRVRVFDGDGEALPDALIELWQADADGRYVRPADPRQVLESKEFCGFGRLPTGADGSCTFETIRPGRVPAEAGQLQASHINVCLFARGLLRQLYTRIYFADDASLATDVVLALVPEARRHTLLAQSSAPGGWQFDVRLQGD